MLVYPKVFNVTSAEMILVTVAPSSADRGFFQAHAGELHFPEMIANLGQLTLSPGGMSLPVFVSCTKFTAPPPKY